MSGLLELVALVVWTVFVYRCGLNDGRRVRSRAFVVTNSPTFTVVSR